MKIRDSVAFVTGANRGIGLAFAQELLAGGARKVYAAARQPERTPLAGVESDRLYVTNPEDVAAAARQCTDVNLLINNAGIALWTGFLAPDSIEAARSEMETNYYGPLLLSRAFAPVLAKNGGGAIVNLLSVLSWVAVPSAGTYSASKAAAWALTNWLRTALREQGTQVVGVHAGPVDTDMASDLTLPKVKPIFVSSTGMPGRSTIYRAFPRKSTNDPGVEAWDSSVLIGSTHKSSCVSLVRSDRWAW